MPLPALLLGHQLIFCFNSVWRQVDVSSFLVQMTNREIIIFRYILWYPCRSLAADECPHQRPGFVPTMGAETQDSPVLSHVPGPSPLAPPHSQLRHLLLVPKKCPHLISWKSYRFHHLCIWDYLSSVTTTIPANENRPHHSLS